MQTHLHELDKQQKLIAGQKENLEENFLWLDAHDMSCFRLFLKTSWRNQCLVLSAVHRM